MLPAASWAAAQALPRPTYPAEGGLLQEAAPANAWSSAWRPGSATHSAPAGRFFYTCARAEGASPEGKCSYFKWVEPKKTDHPLTSSGVGQGPGKRQKLGQDGQTGTGAAGNREKRKGGGCTAVA